MKLKEWVKEKGVKPEWVARKLKIKLHRAYRLISGEFEPTLAETLAVETLTRRKVRMEDFINEAKERAANGSGKTA